MLPQMLFTEPGKIEVGVVLEINQDPLQGKIELGLVLESNQDPLPLQGPDHHLKIQIHQLQFQVQLQQQ